MNPKRVAQVIDSLEEKAQLARLRQTALSKVTSISDTGLREAILEALSRPGAAAINPSTLANQIIREERKRLTEQTEDRAQLKAMVKDLYDNQLWKVQRITRTESANAYWLSQLIGWREQGIVEFTFHSHDYSQGTTHSVEEWLAAGRYPLSSHTHPQCRCWGTPVISHVTLESMEELYQDRPDLFAPGQTVFDRYQLEIEDVVKEYQKIYKTAIEDMPVEHEHEVKEALGIIKETPHQEFQPERLRFVKDVGDTEEFKEFVPTPEPILGQVTAWSSPENELLLSQFAVEGNTISGAIIREWAGKVYDADDMLQDAVGGFFKRDVVQPGNISPKTIAKLLDTFEPWTMMRLQLIEGQETVALEKRLRDAREPKLRSILENLGIPPADIDTIVSWREDRPVWDMSGQYIPQEEPVGSYRNHFINRVAERGPRDLFVESAVSYVADPWTLFRRDPDMYALLKDDVFGGKEFRET
jgi:hypothetical protein